MRALSLSLPTSANQSARMNKGLAQPDQEMETFNLETASFPEFNFPMGGVVERQGKHISFLQDKVSNLLPSNSRC